MHIQITSPSKGWPSTKVEEVKRKLEPLFSRVETELKYLVRRRDGFRWTIIINVNPPADEVTYQVNVTWVKKDYKSHTNLPFDLGRLSSSESRPLVFYLATKTCGLVTADISDQVAVKRLARCVMDDIRIK